MGTRALTTIINEEKQEIAVIYSQWDGYPQWAWTRPVQLPQRHPSRQWTDNE